MHMGVTGMCQGTNRWGGCSGFGVLKKVGSKKKEIGEKMETGVGIREGVGEMGVPWGPLKGPERACSCLEHIRLYVSKREHASAGSSAGWISAMRRTWPGGLL